MNRIFLILAFFLLLNWRSFSINVPLCKNGLVSVKFKNTDGTLDNTTSASLCHDLTYLYVNWENVDDEIISTYNKCNDPLYNEDAVEIFLSSPKSFDQHKYYQFQVSPKGQLFFSDITNPSGNCSNFSGKLQECDLVQYSGKIAKNGWEARLQVKLDIVGRHQNPSYLLGNIFRIDKSSHRPTRYLAMNPTMTPTPCFHVTSKFQKFVLMGNSLNLNEQ